MKVNEQLRKYVEAHILTQYDINNVGGHGRTHIETVIARSFELAKAFDLDVNPDMVYTIAAYHDIGHHIDPKTHEKVSAEIMWADKNLQEFFSEDELKTIREAIEDHRASSDHEPRSIYGKIVSSADRNNTVEQCLERSYYYGKRLEPSATDQELFERAFKHLNLKFGINGYAKFYLQDREYENFLEDIRKILKNKEEFCKIQEKHIKELERRRDQQ